MGRVLVVESEPSARGSLREHLRAAGHQTLEAQTGIEARAAVERGVDVVLLGEQLPDVDGLELLQSFRAERPEVMVIVLTPRASVEHAVEAMRAGAFSYAQTPIDLEEVTLTVERALEAARLRREVRALRRDGAPGLATLIGESKAMMDLRALIAKVAKSPASTVLITGESGTGKGLVARIIHELSGRGGGPFVNVTSSALATNLVESELFGHERGAFTDAKARKMGLVEHARGGTLFLDEIGELEPGTQAKLLGLVEEKTFRRVGGTSDIQADVRIIAATNVDLEAAVRAGRFREDLFYRLAVLTLPIPALRERKRDVELLANHYAQHFGREFNKPIEGIAPRAIEYLTAYHWPGNVRELRNAVERAVLLSESGTLGVEDFPVPKGAPPCAPSSMVTQVITGGANGFVTLRELERRYIDEVLAHVGGSNTKAAAILGIDASTIYRRRRASDKG